MKSRWFNYRPLFLIFAFLALGSVISLYICGGTLSIVLTIIFSLATLVLLIVIAVLKRKPKYFFVPFVAFVVGVAMYYGGVALFNRGVDYEPETISARVYNVSNMADGRVTLRADDVEFNGKKINDNITIFVYDNTGLFENLEIGAKISFTPRTFYKNELFFDGIPNSRNYRDKLKYSTSVYAENIEYKGTDKTFAEKIKQKVRDNLDGVLSNENIEIAYSSLFGDKSLLFDDVGASFKLAGVAHIIAVSGLHVGIIVGVIFGIMKLLHIKNEWAKFIITTIFLGFYCYICGFAISVIRASVMAICLMLSRIFKREYDSLSAISLAGIILFVFDPFVIFDVGFLMSFSCVLGIVFISRPIKKALLHTKMPKWLAEALALSISTMVSLIFVMAYFFKTFNAISLIANMVIIPIFTFAYTILFLLTMFSLILPFLRYLIVLIDPIFEFVRITATFFAGVNWANLGTISFQFIAIIIYFLLLLIISRICTAKRGYRAIITLPIVAILLLFLI